MGKIVTIDPVTRIEGHLRVDIKVENGQVSDAWSAGSMFRGIEQILIGRDPGEAWIFTQRFCRRVDLGLKECADAARSALPPQKADDLDVLFSRCGRESRKRSSGQSDPIHRPIRPGDHIVGADDKMVDPVGGAFRFNVVHRKLLLTF